jgi:hypothetical protein
MVGLMLAVAASAAAGGGAVAWRWKERKRRKARAARAQGGALHAAVLTPAVAPPPQAPQTKVSPPPASAPFPTTRPAVPAGILPGEPVFRPAVQPHKAVLNDGELRAAVLPPPAPLSAALIRLGGSQASPLPSTRTHPSFRTQVTDF